MGKPVIYLVDDEPDVVDVLSGFAEARDWDVRAFTRSADFMRDFDPVGQSVIVLDVVMPDIDGIEILKWLDGEGARCSVVLISGFDRVYLKAAREIGRAKGVNIAATLDKPILKDEFIGVIDNILSIQSMRRDRPVFDSSLPFEELPAELSVGHEKMDADHLHLLNIVRAYAQAMERGDSGHVMGVILSELGEYAARHFEDEEALMLSSGYPQFESHREVHRALQAKVEDIAAGASGEDGGGRESDLAVFLHDWLYNHIMSMDKLYEAWVNKTT